MPLRLVVQPGGTMHAKPVHAASFGEPLSVGVNTIELSAPLTSVLSSSPPPSASRSEVVASVEPANPASKPERAPLPQRHASKALPSLLHTWNPAHAPGPAHATEAPGVHAWLGDDELPPQRTRAASIMTKIEAVSGENRMGRIVRVYLS